MCCGFLAGSGKTTFLHRLVAHTHESNIRGYVMNLDPAVMTLPFGANIDIRDTVKYKEVMKQFNLGPNGGILTSLNLFATKFDEVKTCLWYICLKILHVGFLALDAAWCCFCNSMLLALNRNIRIEWLHCSSWCLFYLSNLFAHVWQSLDWLLGDGSILCSFSTNSFGYARNVVLLAPALSFILLFLPSIQNEFIIIVNFRLSMLSRSEQISLIMFLWTLLVRLRYSLGQLLVLSSQKHLLQHFLLLSRM